MGQMIVQHFRGLKEHYNVVSHGQGIYFATDTKEIILNGEPYSGEGSDAFISLLSQVEGNTEALNVLNGTGEGSVSKSINDAFNEFATNVSNDNVVNTFKELVDYAAQHSAEIVELVGEIDAVKQHNTEQDNRIEALEVLVGSTEGEGSSLIETVNSHTEFIQVLQKDVDAVEANSANNTAEINALKNLVGETSVAEQIENALAWEDVV